MPGTYYGYWLKSENLKVGGPLPEKLSKTAPSEKTKYLMIGTDGKIILSAFVCFKRNNQDYCLKGADESAVTSNRDIMKNAFSDVIDSCDGSVESKIYVCYNSIYISSNLSGNVSATDATGYCSVNEEGILACGN